MDSESGALLAKEATQGWLVGQASWGSSFSVHACTGCSTTHPSAARLGPDQPLDLLLAAFIMVYVTAVCFPCSGAPGFKVDQCRAEYITIEEDGTRTESYNEDGYW